ncbi:MAG: hypothetical protein E7624_08220 [Ruminococcaceae bacterium]|nr:hypothetical protein [Oscillospiraceae bacterium]
MSKRKLTPMQWIIRVLIVLLFCVAVFVAFGRLIEWNEEQKKIEELEKQKEELQQGAGQSD